MPRLWNTKRKRLLHSLRRNINIKILLFNNQIYDFTEGQYSPTSEIGKITKSTPFGSVDEPLNPLSVALGAEATFVARTHDLDRNHMGEMFRRAWEHTGAAFVEVYQNRNVFNDGAFAEITKKDKRASMLIQLRHGEPIRFGSDHERGVMMSRTRELQIVDVADGGRTSWCTTSVPTRRRRRAGHVESRFSTEKYTRR